MIGLLKAFAFWLVWLLIFSGVAYLFGIEFGARVVALYYVMRMFDLIIGAVAAVASPKQTEIL